MTPEESFALASGMNARGSTEVIIATIGLSMGVLKVTGTKSGFDKKTVDVTAGFQGPLAIVVAKAKHLKPALTNDFKIIVPVSGSGASRRGAEVAVALARSSATPIHLIYVSTTRDRGIRRDNASASLVDKEAILKDTAARAARYEVDVTTSVRASARTRGSNPPGSLRLPGRSADYGLDRIHGDTFSFGGVADAVLRKSKVSVLLVSNGEGGQ